MSLLKRFAVGSILAIMATSFVYCSPKQAESLADRQLIVIQTDSWSKSVGLGYRFIGRPGSWQLQGQPFPVSLGRSGLGWGIGEHGKNGVDGPTKREGDGRSPAGRFGISSAFGRGQRSLKLPYEDVKPGRVCVDDSASSNYNTILSVPATGPTWSTAEDLFGTDVYDLGLVIAHNVSPVRPSKGSCIFFHRWSFVGGSTAGCTAMSSEHLAALIAWLDPSLKPSVVQLPKAQYEALRSAWGLPNLSAVIGPQSPIK